MKMDENGWEPGFDGEKNREHGDTQRGRLVQWDDSRRNMKEWKWRYNGDCELSYGSYVIALSWLVIH